MNNLIKKYVYIFISIIMAIIIMISPRSTVIKIILIIIQIPINKILDRYFIDKFSKNIKVLNLKKLNYLGMSPKFEIIIYIYVFLFVYSLTFLYILGFNVAFIGSRIIKLILIIPILLVLVESIYGKHVEEKKLSDGTIIYNVSYNSKESNSIFGIRVGNFEEGILIEDYIFYNDEIYFTTYSQDFEFIFVLTNDRKIVIRDKKAVKFFKEQYK